MYLVVKQPDGLKLQYSVFSIVVAYGGNRLPAELPPQASITIFCHLWADTRHRNGSTHSGTRPLFTYLAVRKGIKDKQIPQNLTKGRCVWQGRRNTAASTPNQCCCLLSQAPDVTVTPRPRRAGCVKSVVSPTHFSSTGAQRDGGDEFSRVRGGTSINEKHIEAVRWYRCR